MNIKNIFFDFDGVLAESVNVKTEAFYQLYLPFGKEVAEKAKAHHLAHGGMSRFEKFKLYHEQFLGEILNEQEIKDWSDRFSKLVVESVIKSDEVEGANKFLQQHHGEYKMFVISGTPTNELQEIIAKRNMSKFFLGIYGSPEKKDVHTKHILDTFQLNAAETIFIGDAKEDQKAAIAHGIKFVLRTWDGNISYFEGDELPRFTNFNELELMLKTI